MEAKRPIDDELSRRNMLKFAGAGLAATALAASATTARAQVPEEANTAPLNIVRKGIDKALEVFNVDMLEEQAKNVYSEGTYVFMAHGSGKQWTLRENQRAWDDYVFTPNRMNGIVRDKIDLSVTLFGERLPHPIIATPFGSHSLLHPAGEIATA